jgi:hypothetical protein
MPLYSVQDDRDTLARLGLQCRVISLHPPKRVWRVWLATHFLDLSYIDPMAPPRTPLSQISGNRRIDHKLTPAQRAEIASARKVGAS